MSLRIRRGTNSQRTGITFDLGEIVYTTDTQKLYIGDGVTAGGKNILETSAGNGFTFNPTTQQIDFSIGNLNLNTAQVSESSNLYFTTERAQDAVGAALVAGNAFNTGVTFTYDDANNRITAVSTGGLTNISADTNPSLGGNLSTGAFSISGNGSITTGTITATNLGGNLSTGAFNISGTGSISAGTISATTGLGANLSLNGRNITGTGNINITGTVTNTKTATPSIDGGNTGVSLTTDGSTPLSITGIGTLGPIGTGGNVYFNINAAKGTISAPTTTAAGDCLGGIAIQGYNGSGYKSAALIVASWDSTAILSDLFPKSTVSLISGGGGTLPRQASFNSQGVFSAPIFKTGSYTTTEMNAIVSPSAGMIIFNTTASDFYGYNGNAWVAFVGP